MTVRALFPLARLTAVPLIAGLVVASPMAAPTPALAQDSAAAQTTLDPDTVIGTINGRQITNRDIDFAIGDLDDQLGQVPEQQRRFAALMALIDIKLLATEAEAQGIGETEAFRNRLAFLRDRALHNSYFRERISDTVSAEDVRARYDSEIAATPPENEISARHILVETRQEAEAIIAELQGGADFEELARERSTGPSGPNGGDLGYFTRGRMVPTFEEAAFTLDPGSFTDEPVETQFGWHVIRVDDRRPVQPPAFEQVEGQIRSVLLRELYFERLQALRGDAAIEITDPDLKTAYDAATGADAQVPDQTTPSE